MTDDLNDLLTRRAERTRAAYDPDTVVALVSARAETATRKRRNRLTVASGAAVVVVATTVGLVIADSGGTSGAGQAGGNPTGGHTVSAKNNGSENNTVSAKGKHVKATVHGGHARKRAAADDTTLVAVDPAPASAEISIGLLPEGYVYLGHDQAETWYGQAGGSSTEPDFQNDIVVDVHESIGDMSTGYTLTVGGKPAQYLGDGSAGVRVRYTDRIDVGFQAPAAAQLSEADALRMAGTLDVRGTDNTTKG